MLYFVRTLFFVSNFISASRYLQKKIFLILIFSGSLINAPAQVFWDGEAYDPNKLVTVDTIVLAGNKVTKNKIILREIIFHTGDTLRAEVLKAAASRTYENLQNTQLFNFVEVHLLPIFDNRINVTIIFKERWYIFPVPIFEFADRNFNEWLLTKDWSRVNYGFYLNWNNFRGRKELLKILVQGGYSQKFSVSYQLPYIDKTQQNGMSFSAGYNRNHEISYSLENSKLLYYKDYDKYIRKEIFGGLRFSHRHDIYNSFSFFGDYRYAQVEDTLLYYNPDYFVNNATYQQFINLGFNYRYDTRDYQVYSSKGFYFEFETAKTGSGVLPNSPSLIYLMANYRNYIPLGNKWNYAFSVKGRLNTLEPAPYYNQRALGYNNDYVRGYEYYVINGQSYAMIKNRIRFTLMKPRKLVIAPIPTEKFNTIPFAFYLNLFADGAYVQDKQFEATNPLANQFVYGYGMGFDIVTYYSIVVRLEYSFNKEFENGFFIHMGAAF